MNRLHHNIAPTAGIAPQVATDNTALVSAIVDRRGYHDAEWIIATGTLADADATFVVLLEHGDDSGLSDAAAVPDNQLLGTEVLAGFTFAADNTTRRLGYIGDKRYLRLTITPSANTGNAPLCAICVLGMPATAPVANP